MNDSNISSQTQQELSHLSRRQRRRRWLYFVILLVMVLAVVAYALLPWLIPTNWLKSQIVAGIQEQLGRSASISAIEISWSDGIIVRDIEINRLEQFGPGLLLKTSRLQLDFHPLRLLLRGQIGSLRVDQPQLWIVADADGKLNLASLPLVETQEGAFEQITITNANLHFIDLVHDSETQLTMSQINVARNADSGQYSLLAQGSQSQTTEGTDKSLFSLRAQFTPTGDGPGLQDILARGSAELIWSNFDLAGLLLPRMGKLDLNILAGKTSGKAKLELHSDGQVELSQCSAELDKLHLRVAKIADLTEPTQIRVPRASFKLDGSYELVSAELTIQTLSGTLDGLDCSSSLQGRFFRAERAFAPSAASLTLTVQPSRLREQFPFLDELFREHDLTLTGTTELALKFEQSAAIDHLSFSINASDTGLHVPELLHKSAGLPCRIELSARIDHNSGLLALDKPLKIELASGRFLLDMHLAQPLRMASFLDLIARPKEILQLAQNQWSQAQIRTSLKIGHIEDLVPVFPVLAGVLSDNAVTLAGPVQAQLNLQPIPTDTPDSPSQAQPSSTTIGPTNLTAEVSFSDQSSFEWPAYFSKVPSEPLSLSFATRLNQGSLRLDDLQVSCKVGQAALYVTDAFCAIQFSSKGFPDIIPSLASAGQLRLENAALFAQVLPALQGFDLDGNLIGQFDLAFGQRASLRLVLDATELALSVPVAAKDGSEVAVWFRKSALTPATLDLQFQADLPSDNNTQAKTLFWPNFITPNADAVALQAKLNWMLGDSIGSLELNRRQAPSKDGFVFDLVLPKIDLDSLDENFPFLAPACKRYQIAGTAAMKLSAWLDPELSLKSLDFDGDFTASQAVLPSLTAQSNVPNSNIAMRKSAHMPLTLQARLVGEDYDEQVRQINIESAKLTFGSSQLNLSGSTLLVKPSQSSSHDLMQSFLRLEPFISAQFDADGTIVFDQDLFALFSPLDLLQRRMELSGVLNHQLEFRAESGQAVLSAKLASGLQPLKVGPAEFRTAEHHFQLFFKPDTDGLVVSGAGLKVDLLELKLFDEQLRLSAELALKKSQLDVSDLSIALGDSSGHFTAHLEGITTTPTGSVSFYSPLIDQSGLEDFAAKLSSFIQQQRASEQTADAAQKILAPSDNSPDHEQDPAVLKKLPPMDINFRAELDKLIISLPDNPVKFTVQQLSLDSELTSASLTGRFTMAFNGGRLAGEHSLAFDKPGLPLSYSYEALNLIADESTAPLVTQVFPNMTVQGTITESRNVKVYLRPGKDLPSFPQEQGFNILRDGIMIGPSAPRWVVSWFPKLSLTKYPFEVAHNVFSRDPETGNISNDMVFLGKGSYNIYINGLTMPDNTTAYALGVDMSLRSLEQRHIWKSLRVPLLTFTGQIVNHKWATQTVSYTWPTRAAWDMFIKNNALKTLIEQWRQTE